MKKIKLQKIKTTYIHTDTQIKVDVNASNGRLTLLVGKKNRYATDEHSFRFIESNPETVHKIGRALMDITNLLKYDKKEEGKN